MTDRTVKGTTVVIPGLRPQVDYLAQIAVVDGGSLGPWSTALKFKTIGDIVAPSPPDNFEVVPRGDSFVATWTAPTTNEDGSPLEGPGGTNDLKNYILRITDAGGGAGFREVTTTDTSYTLTFNENRNIFGVPKPRLTFQIASRDEVGNTSQFVAFHAVNPPPIAPTLTGQNGAIVILEWTRNDEDIARYEVYRDSILIGTVSAGTLGFQDADLSPPGDYRYHVRAIDVFGQGTNSNSIVRTKSSFWEDATMPPKAPTNLSETATIIGPNYVEVVIEWDAPVEDEDDSDYLDHHGFDVRYKVSPSDEWTIGYVTDDRDEGFTPKRFVAYIDGLPAGRELSWGVRAVDGSNNKSDWVYSDVMMPEDTTPPEPPTGVSVNGGIGTIYVFWDSNEEADLDGYQVYMSRTPGVTSESGELVYDGPGTSTSMFGLGDAEQWYVVVYAYDLSGNISLPSTEESASTIDFGGDTEPPPDVTLRPEGLTTSAYWHGSTEMSYIDVSWDGVEDSTLAGYIIAWRETADTDWREEYAGPTATTARVSALKPGVSHSVRVRAIDAAGNVSVNWSAVVQITTAASTNLPPDNVTGVVATAGVGKVIFSWPDNTQPSFNDFHLQVATNAAFTANVRNIFTKSNEYHFTGTTGQTYYARVRARTQFNLLSVAWSNVVSGAPTGIQTSDINLLDLSQGGKFTGVLHASRIQVGSASSFAPGYNPADKPSIADVNSAVDGVESYASDLARAIRGDFTGTATGTKITESGIEAGAITGELLNADIAVINGLQVQSLFQMNAAGTIRSAGFVAGSSGYRLTSTTIEHYGSSFILGANGLNLNSSTGQLWFGGSGTFAGAAFRVNNSGRVRIGTTDTGVHFWEDGSIRIGAAGTTAPVYITNAGVATFRNIRIAPGSTPPNNTNIINAGDRFIVRHLSGGVYETRIKGDLWIDAGGSLRLAGGNIRLTSGNMTLDGGNVIVSSGRITSNMNYTGSGTGFSLSSGGQLRASNAIISGQIEVTSSNSIYTKTEVNQGFDQAGTAAAGDRSIRNNFGGSNTATTITGNAIRTGTIRSQVNDPATGLPMWELSLNGALTARTGYFSGELLAASGTFRGALVASAGTFTGNLVGNDMRLTGTLKMNGNTGARLELNHTTGISAYSSNGARVFWVPASTGHTYWYNNSGTQMVSISASTGRLTASDVNLTGTINATGGSISGTMNVTGTLRGGNVSISGSGISIVGSTLQSSNIRWTLGSTNLGTISVTNLGLMGIQSTGTMSLTSGTAINLNADHVNIGTRNSAGYVYAQGSGEVMRVGTGTTSQSSYIAYYRSSARQGWVGFGSPSTTSDFSISNENSSSTSYLRLINGSVQIRSASPHYCEGNLSVAGSKNAIIRDFVSDKSYNWAAVEYDNPGTLGTIIRAQEVPADGELRIPLPDYYSRMASDPVAFLSPAGPLGEGQPAYAYFEGWDDEKPVLVVVGAPGRYNILVNMVRIDLPDWRHEVVDDSWDKIDDIDGSAFMNRIETEAHVEYDHRERLTRYTGSE